MTKGLLEYLKQCSYFSALKDLGVDFLSNDVNCASIEKAPIKPLIEEYIDGTSKRQVAYLLRARFDYSDEIKNNIEQSEFYEKVAEWIEENNENDIFPNFGDKKIVLNVEVVSSDYLASVADNFQSACYQLQIKITYLKEANNNEL